MSQAANNKPNANHGRLDGKQRHRLRKLLFMKYTPSELANEIGVDVRNVYRIYLPLGCPHERDSRRHIWIVGSQFRDWYLANYKKRKLAQNEAYCVSCKKAVEITEPLEKTKEGLTYITFTCPGCGHKVAKILSMKRR